MLCRWLPYRQQQAGDVRGHTIGAKGPNDPFLHNGEHTALPATAPTRTSIAPQASRRIGVAVAGPIKRLAVSIARYAPAARLLTGSIPAIVDHRLLSTCSHELPPPQPITDPPTR